MESQTEEARQKRREKILARAANGLPEAEEDTEIHEEQPKRSVFQRYRNLKSRQQQEKKLSDISKGVGILIALLAVFLPITAVFCTVSIAMIILALRISGQGQKSKGDEFNWLGKLGFLVNKLKNLERTLFVGKIVMNTFLSYLVAAVLVNVIEVNTKYLIGEI